MEIAANIAQEAIEVDTACSSLKDRCRELVNQITEIQPVRAVGSEELANPHIFQTLETLARLLAELDRRGQGRLKANLLSFINLTHNGILNLRNGGRWAIKSINFSISQPVHAGI